MNTVKMQRDGKDADVHPEEVKNMQSHGWVVVDVKEEVKRGRKPKDKEEE